MKKVIKLIIYEIICFSINYINHSCIRSNKFYTEGLSSLSTVTRSEPQRRV